MRGGLICGLLSLSILSFSQVQVGSTINGDAIEDNFGISVAISNSGSIIAVGASLNDDNGNDAGKVKVYEETAGVWNQVGQDILGASAENQFCIVSLSANGNILAVGAPANSDNGGFSGHTRIFENVAGTWTQIGQTIVGETGFNFSGFSVKLSAAGDVVAISSPTNSNTTTNAGKVEVFQNIAGTWTQIGQDINGISASDLSGLSIAISEDANTLAVGANDNASDFSFKGRVRVYENIAGTWTQVGADIEGLAANDRFGNAVALSADGSIVAAGAREGTNTNLGYVRVFENMAGVWTQIGQDLIGEAADDFFGSSVDLSSNGNIIAIGGNENDGAATDGGHVRVYELIAGTWTQLEADIDGPTVNSFSGTSVAISASGYRTVIGAPGDPFSASIAGEARVFEFPLILPVELISFYGNEETNGIQLNWKTAQEENNASFEIQRAVDGIEWQSIHFEEARGHNSLNSYSFLDTEPNEGLNFYRLKQFDNDGRFHFSDMIAIDWNTEKEVGLTFMNPSRNGVAVQVTNPEGSAFRLSAITPSGQIAWQSPKIANQTTWSQTIPLPTGAYFLHLQLNNKTITERVIIQD